MKKLLIILLSTLSLTAFAEQTIALLEPRVGDGSSPVTAMEKNMVRGELRKAIVNFSDFDAITRSDIDQIMKEQNFQRTGMVSDAQIKQLGEMSGADYICVATLTKSNTEFYLEAYLIHLESGRMFNPASQYGDLVNGKLSNMFPACQALAKELLKNQESVKSNRRKENDIETINSNIDTKYVHDFGSIKEDGGRVKYVFELDIPNIFSIQSVTTSCSCVTYIYSSNSSNTKTLLTVTYNPKGRPGKFQKSVTVTTEGGDIIKLYIKGNVIPAL